MAPEKKFKSIDEYIATFPKNIQNILEEMRQAIREAEETISYQIPVFKLNGDLVWFAAFKDHIGFYPRVQVLRYSKKSRLAMK